MIKPINIVYNTHAGTHARAQAYKQLYSSVSLLILLKFFSHILVCLLNIASEGQKCFTDH
jgi:hypothetical protein